MRTFASCLKFMKPVAFNWVLETKNANAYFIQADVKIIKFTR
jgi:hypothetical protein